MTRTHPRSLIMLQHPIQYQLILPSIYDTCQAELLLTKASTLCPKDHSTNLRGFKVSSNIDVTSDVQEPICIPKCVHTEQFTVPFYFHAQQVCITTLLFSTWYLQAL